MVSNEARSSDLSLAERIDNDAADWLARLDSHGLLDDQPKLDQLADSHDDFQSWLNESLSHRTAFLRLQTAWANANRLSALKTSNRDLRSQSSSWMKPVQAISALAAAIAIAIALFLFAQQPAITPETVIYAYATETGQQRDVNLDDGSTITMNTQSNLEVSFSDANRRVSLENGEAFFSVSRDETRPFEVDAGRGQITVLGTQFSVRRRGDVTEVTVLEGRVLVEGEPTPFGRPSSILTAGMIAIVDDGGVVREIVGDSAIDRLLSWREGKLNFSGTPLSDAVAEFNRYNDTQLVLTDDSIGDIEIGGTFTATNVLAFARLADTGLGLKTRTNGSVIEISPN